MFKISGSVRDRPGNTKVHHLDAAIIRNHDVGGFDVAVNNAGCMRDLEGSQHAICHFEHVALLKGASFHQVAEQVSFDVFHDDIGGGATRRACAIGPIFFITGVKHSNNRRVGHFGCRHSLQAKAVPKGGIRRQSGFEHLDSHLAA